MYIKHLEVNGAVFENVPADIPALVELGMTEEDAQAVIDAENQRLEPIIAREKRTKAIADEIPLPSLVGTAADGATAGSIMDSVMVLSIRDLPDDNPLKMAFKARINAMFAEVDGDETGFDRLAARCEQYLTDISTGAVKIPFLIKYGSIMPVFDDVGARNTLVAEKLASPL